MVGRPSWWPVSGLKALPVGQEWSRALTGWPEVDRRPSQEAGNDTEAIVVVQNWARTPPGGPELGQSPSLWAGSGQEGLWGVSGVVGRLSQRAGSGQEALQVDWETLPVGRVWSGCPSSGPRVVRSPSRRARSG